MIWLHIAPIVGPDEYSANDWRAATSVQRAAVTWQEWDQWVYPYFQACVLPWFITLKNKKTLCTNFIEHFYCITMDQIRDFLICSRSPIDANTMVFERPMDSFSRHGRVLHTSPDLPWNAQACVSKPTNVLVGRRWKEIQHARLENQSSFHYHRLLPIHWRAEI